MSALVRRREVLVVAAAAGGVALTGGGGPAHGAGPISPAAALTLRLQGLMGTGLVGRPRPLSATEAQRGLVAVKADVRASRYGLLADRLPTLIAAAESSRAEVPASMAGALNAALAGLYVVAAEAMTKFGAPAVAASAVARAWGYADCCDDVLAAADVAQMRGILARKAGRFAEATRQVIAAADHIDLTDPAGHLAVRGGLLCTAAYTAARAGDRQGSRDLLDAAAKAAARLSDEVRFEPAFGFNSTNVVFYRMGVADALGDPGLAIRLAHTVRLDAVRPAERRVRFWLDVARASSHLGRRQACLQALQEAERVAPAEVRARAATRDLVRWLIDTPGRVDAAGLRALATRVEVSR